jgi:uncharacterized protein (TIGR02680 family)
MLELQRQLRRPQLSNSLDADELSDILTKALPEVNHRLISDIGAHLDDIEQLRQDLRSLTEVSDGFRTFLDTYQLYARAVVAERANEVLTADREARRAKAELTTKRASAQAAKDEVARLGDELRSLDGELQNKRGAEQEMLRSDGIRSARELAELREVISSLESEVDQRAAEFEAAQTQAAEERERRDKQQDLQRGALQLGDATETEMAALATLTGLEHHEVLAKQLRASDRPQILGKTLREQVSERRTDLARQRDLRSAADRCGQEASSREAAASRAEGHLRDGESRLATCESELTVQREGLVEASQTWVDSLQVLVLSEGQTDQFLDAANSAGDTNGSLRAALGEPIQAHESSWTRTELELQAARERLAQQRAPLESERTDLEAMGTPEPDRVYTRTAERAGRPGSPLWRLVDFRDHTLPEHHAGLEAALEGSGLLDAWVLPDGGLLDVDSDIALTPGQQADGRRLSELLCPAEGPVPHMVVEAILNAVGIGDIATASKGVRVDVDGSFRVGPATGRYGKDEGRFIGAEARERNRARRIAELNALLAELGDREAEVERGLITLDEKRRGLRSELTRLPPEDAVRSAFGAVRESERHLSTLRLDAKEARREADVAIEAAATARKLAAAHARERRLPAAGAQPSLEAFEQALSDYASRIGELVLHTSSAALYGAQVAATEARVTREDARAKDLDEQRERAGALLHRRRGALQALEASKGADAQSKLAQLEALQAAIGDLDVKVKKCGTAKEHAAVEYGKLETAILGVEGVVRDRELLLAARLTRFRALDGPDFLRLAVEADAPSRGELQGWQASNVQQFVRTSSDVLRPTAAVEDLMNRVESEYSRLLGGLDGSVGVQPFRQRQDGLDVVAATRAGQQISVRTLMSSLDEEIRAQQRNLTEADQRTFERFLFNGIAQELRSRLKAAHDLVEDTNDAIARCQTSSGVTLELSWSPKAEADPLLRRALKLLESPSEGLSPAEREQLIRFFRERVEAARLDQEEGTAIHHLLVALDYRHWHQFHVLQTKDGVRAELTKQQHQAGSGGEKAAALHLPLFAAASAHMQSAAPYAPRLVMLDEAFAGIDGKMRPQLLGLIETFDLDFMLTSHELWCCERELAHLSIYQLHREEGISGVATVHFVWEGATGTKIEVDDAGAVAA